MSVFSGESASVPRSAWPRELCGGKAETRSTPPARWTDPHLFLIHDDLPAMDNDDMRRGKPSSHKAFGEANASRGATACRRWRFNALSLCPARTRWNTSEKARLKWSWASLESTRRGQALLPSCRTIRPRALSRGRRLGAHAPAQHRQREALVRFADAYGLLFQITDDILDFEGTRRCSARASKRRAGRQDHVLSRYTASIRRRSLRTIARQAREAVLEANADAPFFME
jgi:geranylgeranyl diphosphate synthase type II